MNLHAMVRGVIPTVNADQQIWLQRSNGYTTLPNGKQMPSYEAPVSGSAQIQPMGKGDLRHMAELNITGVFRKVYLYGHWMGVVRADKTGGDILTFSQIPGEFKSLPFLAPTTINNRGYLAPLQVTKNSPNWKVVDVMETWPDWCCVVVVLQND